MTIFAMSIRHSARFSASVVVFVISFFVYASCSSVDQNALIHKKVLEFRKIVHGKIYPNTSLLNSYINDDLYIYRWLQSSNFAVDQGVRAFMKHMAWRQEENIDTIDLEDWEDFVQEYSAFYNCTDKAGRPIAEIWFSSWDIRRAAFGGETKKLVRWMVHVTEMVQRRLYKIRETNKNITGAVELLDFEGLNAHHFCSTCNMFHLANVQTSDDHYPFLFEKVIMVNAGGFFRHIFSTLNQQFGSRKSARPSIYSGNRKEWLPVLDKEIEKSERSTRFGGSLSRMIN